MVMLKLYVWSDMVLLWGGLLVWGSEQDEEE
jgi:hypothetical protein